MAEHDDEETPHLRVRELRDQRTGRSAARARMAEQHLWVDQQIRVAMARGEFDDLPGAGQPIKDLGEHHDPEWWVKQLVEREKIAVLPLSVQLRKDDAELDAGLDAMSAEVEVRRAIADFNERVIRARYAVPEGPPLVTQPRDVEATVEAWAERRAARRAAAARDRTEERRPRPWWRRSRPRT